MSLYQRSLNDLNDLNVMFKAKMAICHFMFCFAGTLITFLGGNIAIFSVHF